MTLLRWILFATVCVFIAAECVSVARAECSSEAIHEAVEQGEQAFAARSMESLLEARLSAEIALNCLGAPMTPQDAAAFHRLMALVSFATNRDLSMLEFYAARRIEPGYNIPPEIAPPGHPLVRFYNEAASVDPGDLQVIHPPANTYVVVDGVRGAQRALGVPVILQLVGSDGVVKDTAYLLPNESLPSWSMDPLEIPPVTVSSARPALRWSAAATGVLAAGFYSAGVVTRNTLYDLENPVADADVPGFKARANTFGGLGVGFAVVSIGLGSASFVVGGD
jgi:hypothetical protein